MNQPANNIPHQSCVRCGSYYIVNGCLGGFGGVLFMPFKTWFSSGVIVHGTGCTDCGYVWFELDYKERKSLRKHVKMPYHG